MYKYLLTLFLVLLMSWEDIFAQKVVDIDSTLNYDLTDVIVTATRREQFLKDATIPVALISREQINQTGSTRLTDILQEQTGMIMTGEVGATGPSPEGLQMNGLDGKYALILVDGEPLVGRSSGVVNLARLTVGNIKQVEIIKGPASSLYGSDALAGVVNIITESAGKDGLSGSVFNTYKSFNTLDLGANMAYAKDKISFSTFLNRYSTDGYDLNNDAYQPTVVPFENYTLGGKLKYELSPRIEASMQGRFFHENQQLQYLLNGESDATYLDGSGIINDWNALAQVNQKLAQKWLINYRLYASQYITEEERFLQTDGTLYDVTSFTQNFLRPEVKSEFFLSDKYIFTFGGGYTYETVLSSRYSNTKFAHSYYGFSQLEWNPLDRLHVNVGARFDQHSIYDGQFSPKLSSQYRFNRWLAVKGSVGVGYKAPDFRHLYLNFGNSVVGYTVLGTEELTNELAQFEAENQIADYLYDVNAIDALQPERSVACHAGVQATLFKEKVALDATLFHNNIQNLIEYQAVALKTNGQYIYSYLNFGRVFTQGVEGELTYQILPNLKLKGGYQFLIAKNYDIINDIKQGEVFKKDLITLQTTRLSLDEYGGLFNRSKHMANIKFFYRDPKSGITANWRSFYRGRFGFGDLNGNQILDDDQEYVDGYITCNMALGKQIKSYIDIQVGCDNIFNYKNPRYVPNIPGRVWWASLRINI